MSLRNRLNKFDFNRFVWLMGWPWIAARHRNLIHHPIIGTGCFHGSLLVLFFSNREVVRWFETRRPLLEVLQRIERRDYRVTLCSVQSINYLFLVLTNCFYFFIALRATFITHLTKISTGTSACAPSLSLLHLSHLFSFDSLLFTQVRFIKLLLPVVGFIIILEFPTSSVAKFWLSNWLSEAIDCLVLPKNVFNLNRFIFMALCLCLLLLVYRIFVNVSLA